MTLGATWVAADRQLRGRLRSRAFWLGATAPVLLIGLVLLGTSAAMGNPATVMFLAILSSLWIGGSGCVREIVDERELVRREPHLSLLNYGLAKILHATLLATGQSVLVAAFIAGSATVSLPFPALWLVLFLATLAGSTMALVLSAASNGAATALAWFPLLLVPQVVFGGFLFPFGPTEPFAVNAVSGRVTVMPEDLIRRPVQSRLVRVAAAICVSRWALETYAASVFEQDLSDTRSLEEAVQVAFYVPLTLVDVPVASRLRNYVQIPAPQRHRPPLRIDAARFRYVLVLLAFIAVQVAILLVLLPLRDPRRA